MSRPPHWLRLFDFETMAARKVRRWGDTTSHQNQGHDEMISPGRHMVRHLSKEIGQSKYVLPAIGRASVAQRHVRRMSGERLKFRPEDTCLGDFFSLRSRPRGPLLRHF